MTLSERELARRTGDQIEIRPEPVRLHFCFDELPCADSHLLTVRFSCAAQVLTNSIERRAFAETFLGTRTTTTADDLIQYFAPAMRTALAQTTLARPAEQWLDAALADELIEALRQAASPREFDAGLKLLAPFELVAQSPSLERERLEQMERDASERRAEGQLAHLQRSAQLLREFQELRAAAPELSAGAALSRLSAADRGDIYQALLLATPSTSGARTLWAVAGQELLRIDLRQAPPAIERIPVGSAPFRSVTVEEVDGRAVLLLGSRSHVLLYDPEKSAHPTFDDPAIDSPLGFNRAILHGNRICATHGQAGVRAWDLDGQLRISIPAEQLPIPSYQSARSRAGSSSQTIASTARGGALAGAHNLIGIDSSRVLLSVGNRLVTVDADSGALTPLKLDLSAEVLAILRDGKRLIVVCDNGTIQALDERTLEPVGEQRRSNRLAAAALLPWMGENRLLLANEDGCIDCIGLEDSLVSEYRSGYRDIRTLCASTTTIAAIVADRTRLILWQTSAGTKPYAEIHASALARHRVADVAFG
jgi:hypothetical protein